MQHDIPFKPLKIKPPQLTVDRRPDGTIYLGSAIEPELQEKSIVHLLARKAKLHPNRGWIAERDNGGDWKYLTYEDGDRLSGNIAQALIDRGMGPSTPLMILSGKSINHALLYMGAMKARVPVASISEAFSRVPGAFPKFQHVFTTVRPFMIFSEQLPQVQGGLQFLADLGHDLSDLEIVGLKGDTSKTEFTPFEDLKAAVATDAVDASIDAITPDTVARYMFTSGSTGMPKAAIITQGGMTANVANVATVETEDFEAPDYDPKASLVWMPWSHSGQGIMNFNHSIRRGATVYLDDGLPVPGKFDETLRNLRELPVTGYTGAPVGYAMLVPALEEDAEFRKHFFTHAEQFFYGAAAMPYDIAERLQKLAVECTGHRISVNSAFGTTEALVVTIVGWATENVEQIGLPIPGVTVKLVPYGDKLEARVKSDALFAGYLGNPEATADAFDDEGFYKLGDAFTFLDKDRPEAGLKFDGRVSEEFKLATGSWVATGNLRINVISELSPIIRDAVVCGLNKDYVSILAWANPDALRKAMPGPLEERDGLFVSDALAEFVRERLADYNKNSGSSTRVARIAVMVEPPSLPAHEITEKGYVNQRATQENRADLVERLYEVDPAPGVITL